MTAYPEIVRALLDDCESYRQQEKDLAVLKSAIWNAAQEITLPEERELRRTLQRTEAELDSIEFTTDSGLVFAKSMKVVDVASNALAQSLGEEL